MTDDEKELLGRLERRAKHLESRIAANPEKRLTWDEKEREALLWAIATLKDLT